MPTAAPCPLAEARRTWPTARALATAMRTGQIDRVRWHQDLARYTASADSVIGSITQVVDVVHDCMPTGPLAGIPIAVKDNIDVLGTVTGLGRPLDEGAVPKADAEVVALLRAAGADITAKTNLPEYATSPITDNQANGPTRNPRDIRRTAGGSSGGSAAAVAADMAVAALGTDTGGSVVVPAGLTGLYGLRPTHGTISTQGVFPLSWSLDTVGILAHEPDAIRLIHREIATLPPRDSVYPRRLKIGVPESWLSECDSEVARTFELALTTLRRHGHLVLPIELSDHREVMAAARVIHLAEAAAVLGPLPKPRTPYAASVEFRRTTATTGPDYAIARQRQRRWKNELRRQFNSVDLLMLPTSPLVAPLLDNITEQDASDLIRFAYPFCFAGLPALSVPSSTDALPVGVTVVAPWAGDADLLDFAEKNPLV